MIAYDSITDRKIRFALVGCGRIAASHFEALRQHLAQQIDLEDQHRLTI